MKSLSIFTPSSNTDSELGTDSQPQLYNLLKDFAEKTNPSALNLDRVQPKAAALAKIRENPEGNS